MSELRFVGGEELTAALSMTAAIDALEEAFAAPALPHTPERAHLDTGAGDLLLMPSWSDIGVGVKLVTVTPSNAERGLSLIAGVYVLFSADTQTPVMLLDGAALTALRTAAVSGVAARHLAPSDAGELVMFGAGTQARSHLDALRAVCDLRKVTVVSRSSGRRDALVQRARELGLKAAAGDPQTVSDADVVCCCTTSTEPLFDGSLLENALAIAVGAYKPTARELDDAAIASGWVVVETAASALAEAGDLVIPLEAGVLDRERVVELSDVVRGRDLRANAADNAIFKSVGAAFEDLVVAGAAYRALIA